MSFSVIIPSRNPANLIPCLQALRKHEPTCPVVIVDDGIDWQKFHNMHGGPLSDFGPIRRADGRLPFVFARNINVGITWADACFPYSSEEPPLDGYVLLNDDALLESPGGFSLLARTCAEHPEIGVLGATTNLTGQPLQVRKSGSGSGLRFMPHIAFVCVYFPRKTLDLMTEMSKTDSLITPGLDERYCIDYGVDDRDACQQMQHLGLKVAVLDSVYVDHGSLTSTYRGLPTNSRSFAENFKLFQKKWAGHHIAL